MKVVTAVAAAMTMMVTAPVAAQDGPDLADVAAIDALIDMIYEVISGPAGQERDWEMFKALFAEDARLVPSGRNPQTGATGFAVWSPEDYAEAAGPQRMQSGFFEVETHRVLEVYGTLAHAWSTYEARQTEDGPVFLRGINSMQLIKNGDQWKVMSIYWSDQNSSGEIPARYRGK